jgi:hypothetical protein
MAETFDEEDEMFLLAQEISLDEYAEGRGEHWEEIPTEDSERAHTTVLSSQELEQTTAEAVLLLEMIDAAEREGDEEDAGEDEEDASSPHSRLSNETQRLESDHQVLIPPLQRPSSIESLFDDPQANVGTIKEAFTGLPLSREQVLKRPVSPSSKSHRRTSSRNRQQKISDALLSVYDKLQGQQARIKHVIETTVEDVTLAALLDLNDKLSNVLHRADSTIRSRTSSVKSKDGSSSSSSRGTSSKDASLAPPPLSSSPPLRQDSKSFSEASPSLPGIVYSLRRGSTRLEIKTAVNQLVHFCTSDEEGQRAEAFKGKKIL